VYGRRLGSVLLWGEISLVIGSTAIFEWDSFNHISEVFKATNSEPAFLSTLDQLEYQGQDGVLRDTATGLVGSEAHGGKGGLNGMGGANMRLMLSGEIEEGQQNISVFDKTGDGFWILRLVGLAKAV
jgi:hypothetical protein